MNIYQKFELESTFVEIINPKKSNITLGGSVGTTYRPPKMDATEFNNILSKLLKKINQEQKTVFLLGDFNIDLMHYNEHKSTNEFLDSVASNSYLPYILFNLVDIQVIPKPLLTIFSVMKGTGQILTRKILCRNTSI